MSARSLLAFCFTLLLLVANYGFAVAAPGDLDPTFNGDGKRILSLSANSDWVEDLAIQSDGRIIAVGRINFRPGVSSSFGVVRFNQDGSLDTSFGTGGVAITTFGDPFEFAQAVAIQADGKIVVCGGSGGLNADEHIVIARYLTDGTLDNSFSNDGRVEAYQGLSSRANSIVIQDDGKIVVAGSAVLDVVVLRYLADGTPDRRFGHRGRIIASNTPQSETAYAVKALPDQKILVAGNFLSGNQLSMFVFRLLPSGKFDPGFGAAGFQSVSMGIGMNTAFDCEVQSDGKVLLGGYYTTGHVGDALWAVSRLTANGMLDSSFAGGGKLLIATGGFEGVAFDLALQQDGKIVLGGFVRETTQQAHSNFLVIRRNSNGSPDTFFGQSGRVQTNLAQASDRILALKIQSNGRILAAGGAVNPDGHSDFALARFLSQ